MERYENQEDYKKLYEIISQWCEISEFKAKKSQITELIYHIYGTFPSLDESSKITPEALINAFCWAVAVRDEYKENKLSDEDIQKRYEHVAKVLCKTLQ